MRRLAAGLLALIVLISCAAVYAASGGESLITQTYLEDTYVPGVLEQAQARWRRRPRASISRRPLYWRVATAHI